jgi:DNA helicase-2/ATP-dependent DNA helicase PcrA
MLVLAGAGTGKTRVVTYRIANLIGHRTRPDRILAVTFTNKAANEMKERVSALLGKPGRRKKKEQAPPEPLVSTFHSLCVRILRRNIDKLGYPLNFSICDRGDQESIARQALREIKVPDKMLKPSDLLAFVSRCKSTSIRPGEAVTIARDDKEHLAASGYRRYQNALKTSGSLDFDDLLLCTEDLFRKSMEARREEAARFDHILIDEYQDTNSSQYRIIKALAGGHRNLCVVGDDDQSIYGWRGAEVKHILRFNQDWPDAKVVRLEDNYRSTSAILGWANELIAFNKTRHDKTLRAARMGGDTPRVQQYKTETDEAEQVAGEIKRHLDAKRCEAGDIAILFRTNEQPRLFETELRRHKIPYVLIGGMSFFDRREVKDVLSFLQVIVKPDDDPALRRIINVPPRGISRPAVELIAKEATQRGVPPWNILGSAASLAGLSPAAKNGCRSLHGLLSAYKRDFASGRSLAETLRKFLHELNFLVELRSRYDTADEIAAREATVEQVVNALAVYEEQKRKPTLLGFLDDIALAGRELESDKEKQLKGNAVTLMTLHSAKGLEFPRVYMIGLEEGILPHHRSIAAEGGEAIEEERRLCYVGVTRAQDHLTLSLALSRRKWGKPHPTDASRFLFELTGQADRFDPHRAKRAGTNRSAALRRKTARRNATSNPPKTKRTTGKKRAP